MPSPATPAKITVSFSPDAVKRMLELLRLSVLPDRPPIPASDEWKHGISLTYLAKLKKLFEDEWSWDDLAAKLNQYDNYSVPVGEGSDAFILHFIHVKSKRADAAPLLLLHGWPGSVYDFVKVIDKLTNPPDGKKAFHLVIPSLPGFFLSTNPQREGWTLVDTSRVFNQLMVDILGYPRYLVHGGDWGSLIVRILGAQYSSTATAVHTTFLFYARELLDPAKTPLTPLEAFALKRGQEFQTNGNAYMMLQRTKPFTIGYTIGASPLSILAYIGEKHYAWSDPDRVDPWDTINTTALYFLTGTAASAALTYHENVDLSLKLAAEREKWRVQSKLGYTHYKYELSAIPAALLHEMSDNIIYKAEHDKGGHFPALDVPDLFVEDLRGCFESITA